MMQLLTRRRFALPLAALFGALGTLAYSPFDFWPCALLSLMGLLLLTLNRSAKQAALVGFVWGFALFITGISWINVSIQQFGGLPVAVGWVLVALLAAYLSLYPALFAALLARLLPYANAARLVFAAPVLWTFTEFLRGWMLTGFPWLQFGYTQIDGPLRGLGPITGVQGITFALMLTSGLLTLALVRRKVIPAVVAVALPLAALPLANLHWVKADGERKINVALVQGNIDQELKWEPAYRIPTLQTYLDMSRPYLQRGDLVIWPEAAIPSLETEENELLSMLDSITRSNKSMLITGVVDRNPQTKQFFNTVIVLGDPQETYQYPTRNRYNKNHLVLFGEYVPFEGLLREIAPLFNLPMSSFSRGDYLQPDLRAGQFHLETAICYEIILGSRMRANFLQNPDTDFLLTVSNDAWFGHSIGPWQHFQMARMRALELGRPLLRATNNGVTAVIDSNGEIQQQIPQFKTAVLSATVVPMRGETPYARFGDWPLWIVSLLTIAAAAVLRQRR
ncbi:apolipoprotein N-acyltransferase [Plesiomonas shigelloides]|uniref:apolipoprotein N-acyltransferase n=1 Tax=Plesiomonas shigelloides TaxID=703 RepID=UPI00351CFD86